MTDADQVRRVLAGQPDAYAELARRWSPRILAVCHARVRHGHIAEDLTQETLLRGFRHLSTLHDADRFGSWILGIAVRACLDWLKARERSQVLFSTLDGDPQFSESMARDAEETLERQEDTTRLMDAIATLPESLRTVIMLFYYDDLSYRELANLLGVSRGTINSRLSQARAQIRERLSDCRRTITHGL